MAGGGGVNLALNINGQPITPDFVADQSLAAQGASYGRTQQAANMQVPGLMVACCRKIFRIAARDSVSQAPSQSSDMGVSRPGGETTCRKPTYYCSSWRGTSQNAVSDSATQHNLSAACSIQELLRTRTIRQVFAGSGQPP